MKKINQFIDKHAIAVSVILFSIALLIDIATYVGSTVEEKFSVYLTVMFSFEVILHGFLIYALIAKNKAISNVFMISIKVFDAIFFAANIAIRADAVINNPQTYKPIPVINFCSYAISSIVLIIILIFFIANYITGKHKYWVVVKACMLVTALVMFLCSILEIYNLIKYSANWFAFLEPMYMCFLMLGMFTVCHFIEKEK